MSLLLVLVAMVLAGTFLQSSLQNYYLDSVRENLEVQGQLLAGLAERSLISEDRSSIQTWVQRFDTELGVSLAVLDANGVVLAGSRDNLSRVGKKLQTDEISHALGGSRGEAIARDQRSGQRQLHLALPIIQSGRVAGVVYLSAPLEKAYSTLQQILRFLVYATLLALAVTGVLGIMLAGTITGPIRALTTQAQAMARGHFDQTIPVHANDEIGQLTQVFNDLALRLNETLQEIRSEKNKAEAILNFMADGLLAMDPAGSVILVNPAAERLLDTRRRAILGKSLAALWPGMGLEAGVQEAHQTGRTVQREIHVKEPRELVLQGFFTPLRGERRQALGAVVVLHDVTEQEKLEQMRRDFVANVSHELRTPLTTVKSYVETLLDGAVEQPDLRTRFLQVVESETDRMVRLVRDLLQMSQMDQGTASWDIRPYDLAYIVEDSLTKLAISLERKGLAVERHIPLRLPQAAVDRDKVQQVVFNVLNNAIEFTPQGGKIKVWLTRAGQFVKVTIQDTGVGIPPEDLPRIFERFYRVDKARSRTMGGTGLGLAIARQIVEALGGKITIASQVGEGTTVTFTVPVASHPAAISG